MDAFPWWRVSGFKTWAKEQGPSAIFSRHLLSGCAGWRGSIGQHLTDERLRYLDQWLMCRSFIFVATPVQCYLQAVWSSVFVNRLFISCGRNSRGVHLILCPFTLFEWRFPFLFFVRKFRMTKASETFSVPCYTSWIVSCRLYCVLITFKKVLQTTMKWLFCCFGCNHRQWLEHCFYHSCGRCARSHFLPQCLFSGMSQRQRTNQFYSSVKFLQDPKVFSWLYDHELKNEIFIIRAAKMRHPTVSMVIVLTWGPTPPPPPALPRVW